MPKAVASRPNFLPQLESNIGGASEILLRQKGAGPDPQPAEHNQTATWTGRINEYLASLVDEDNFLWSVRQIDSEAHNYDVLALRAVGGKNVELPPSFMPMEKHSCH
ncbi:hypothetical protein CERZMDRAFT_92222 [Cercospora zeae-maydis SCOH1-5]|uniref:Uncharacterized protein n=1 Tax=Cercospora zeae-maydis SCOH1-5 TaxID=717836 RepID=A0A6A6FVR9_9PEZI|nr:hypothetical protein CERZMDRAFT_92222 [Cercospora zeae-maydis SCOH1-5]